MLSPTKIRFNLIPVGYMNKNFIQYVLAEIPHAALRVFKNKDNLNGVGWHYRGGEEDA